MCIICSIDFYYSNCTLPISLCYSAVTVRAPEKYTEHSPAALEVSAVLSSVCPY